MDIRSLAEFLDPGNSPELVTMDDRGAPYYNLIDPTGCVAAVCQNNRGMLLIRIRSVGTRTGLTTYRGEYYANISPIEMVTTLKRLSGDTRRDIRITREDLFTGLQCAVIGFAAGDARSVITPSSINLEWPDPPR